ncbi:ATP-binding protein [Nonomuraea sp. NPDC050227]|uniref:ATP-binding protein n=1 Tax=Nonomuraea sp. NPDC050227 TaxID=3364360 RepID=UPI0037909CBE
MLRGRDKELGEAARLLERARAGQSGVLVLRGEAGIGKSALLEELVRRARGVRVLRATAVEAETSLPFAGLQMVLRPVLDRLDTLPGVQAAALRGALGLADAAGTSRFLVGLAVLSLLSELAAQRPVLCLIDDAHWLDAASADALLFAARRLAADGVAMVFAARDAFDAPGLPELRLGGLDEAAAAEVLAQRFSTMASSVRDRVVREAGGNPLALIELPAGLSPEQRAGREAMPGALPATDRVVAGFGAQIDELPARARLAVLVAAAEGSGDLGTVLRAARALGGGVADLEAAEKAGLLRITGASIAFRHPLVRSAAYQRAPLGLRVAAHEALAAVVDAERRVWHLAAAATGPQEGIAALLEETAVAARGRGAMATAASILEQAALLSPDRAERARRTTLAARAAVAGGRTEQAAALAERAAELGGHSAGLALVRASVAFERGTPRGAAQVLADGAQTILRDDPGLALTMLTMAASNAWPAGEIDAVRRVARLAGSFAGPTARAIEALAGLADDDHANALPALTALVAQARTNPLDDALARIFVVGVALFLGDDEAVAELAAADVIRCRNEGLAGALPVTLHALAHAQLMAGRHRDAAATVAEAVDLARDTGQSHRIGQLTAITARIAAIEGGPEHGSDPVHRGLFHLTFGRYEQAFREIEGVSAVSAAPDLVEAAVRVEAADRAAGAHARFAAWAEAGRQPWAQAVALRCRALLGPAGEAGEHYAQAVRLHRRGGRPFERARTELLYGEWLRRARRRAEARSPLRSALEIFDRLGAAPWAGRARAELRATGESAPDGPPADALAALTPQELQVVRLAAAGVSNRDIAAQLFLSHRTVEYHLYKAYPKLGVASRQELARLV